MEPVQPGQRIRSVDTLRGFALLGILLMNVISFSLPVPAYWDPSVQGGDTGWNLRFYMFNSLLVEGSMRAIFAMLFGAGVILFTSRLSMEGSPADTAVAWYRRTIWLILFGLLHAYLFIFPGEVLFYYGMVGLLLFPVRHARPSRLLLFSLLLLGILATLRIAEYRSNALLSRDSEAAREALAEGGNITPQQAAGMALWDQRLRKFKPDEAEKEKLMDSMRSGYLSALATMAPYILYMQTGYFFRTGFLDTLSMMLLGMALFRWGVFHARRSPLFYLGMVLTGYGTGITVNWLETHPYIQSGFDPLTWYRVRQSYDLGRVFIAIGHIGIIMLFSRWHAFRRLKSALAAVGRMALTNYLMQSLVGAVIFIGFKQYGQWQRYQLFYLVAGIWIFQLIFSPLWLSHFRYGPMEWLWRKLTYGRGSMHRDGVI